MILIFYKNNHFDGIAFWFNSLILIDTCWLTDWMNEECLEHAGEFKFVQGTLKGEVSLYSWPPVWPVWNQLYDTVNFCFYLQNRLSQTSQTGGQRHSDTSPFSISLVCPWAHPHLRLQLTMRSACMQLSRPLSHSLSLSLLPSFSLLLSLSLWPVKRVRERERGKEIERERKGGRDNCYFNF